MLKRKVYDELLNWKKNKKNECLLVKGARQIGKTYIIREFGKTNYKYFYELNFIQNPEYKDIFNNSLKSDDILAFISLKVQNFVLEPNNTLIFLDEIQECPNARTSMKFLASDDRYDVICSGSLLGINYKDVVSYPVGFGPHLEMHSLDFEEFLWAKGINQESIQNVKKYFINREQVPSFINNTMFDYLKEYIIVGGMPDVVLSFITDKNFNKVHAAQQKILDDYEMDVKKYASINEKPKIRNVYYSIPNQLAKENKKFMYSVIDKKSSARKYENSLEWLRDANLIKFCYNVTTPTYPLITYEKDNEFKIYAHDIGLLVFMYGFQMKNIIMNNLLVGNAKGAIYESLIADIFIKKKYPLNYYKKSNSTQEIEFLISDNSGNIIPYEIKASNKFSISLNEYLDKSDVPYGYKLITGNLGVSDKKITIPLYMAMFL
ncbi:MAG: ATP-binding protein [Acholeplasmatales bacterium]|jgi:predicted AAA+ superfamily ATPase|nr:ATP-binding protein [Acholeplasmatales bacterium]